MGCNMHYFEFTNSENFLHLYIVYIYDKTTVHCFYLDCISVYILHTKFMEMK